MLKSAQNRIRLLMLILLTVTIATGTALTLYLRSIALHETTQDNDTTTAITITFLTGKVKALEGALAILSASPSILPALSEPSIETMDKANTALDRFNQGIDASVTYLLDLNGTTIASSNRNAPGSFIGKNYAQRPYFTEALKTGTGFYTALGLTSQRMGFYASRSILNKTGDPIGVVVMKQEINPIENALKKYSHIFCINRDGIIFLSNKTDMILKSLWPIDPTREKGVLASEQFGKKPFTPVFKNTIHNRDTVNFNHQEFLISRQHSGISDWDVVTLEPTNKIIFYTWVGIVGTIFISCLWLFPLFFIHIIIRDINARKQAETNLQIAYADLKATQDKLLQSEKMASLGLLAAGVAHEINNPLAWVTENLTVVHRYLIHFRNLIKTTQSALKSYTTQANNNHPLSHQFDAILKDDSIDAISNDIDPLLSQTKEGLMRIQAIVADLKTFSHSDPVIRSSVDVNRAMDRSIMACSKELNLKAVVIKEYGNIPNVSGNTIKLEQVFINLLSNACHAIDGKGTITINTSLHENNVCVKVTDNGKGISAEHLDKIFDPFFTTKPVGQGTGLGLSVSYDIIKQYGGDILVKSEQGIGTTFTVVLPVA